MVLGETPDSPLDSKEIKPINPKRYQPWIFIGETDAEAESLILWPTESKSQLIRKYPDAGKDWRQEEKGMTEDEMVGWHYWLNGHEFQQAPGDGEGKGGLVCCSPGGCKQPQLSNGTTIYTLKSLISQTTYYSKIISTRKSVLRITGQWRPSAKCDDLQTFHNYYFYSQNTVVYLMLPNLMTLMHFWYHSNSLHRKALTKLESKSKVKNIFDM